MYRRKYQRKRGVKRALVMLLTLVMLVSVCLPAMQVSAEEVNGETASTEETFENTLTVQVTDTQDEYDAQAGTEGLVADAAGDLDSQPTVLPETLLVKKSQESSNYDAPEGTAASENPEGETTVSEAAKAYLDRIEELKGQLWNLDPDASDYEEQLDAIVAEIGAVVESAASDTALTEEEYEAISNAADAVLDGQEELPEEKSDFAKTAQIVNGGNSLTIHFVDEDGNPLNSTNQSFQVDSDWVDFKTIAAQYSVSGYTYSRAYYHNWRNQQVTLTNIRYSSNILNRWGVNDGDGSLSNGTSVYLVYASSSSSNDSFVSEGNAAHLEVMVNATAKLNIEGETDVTATIQLTTSDVFTISATWNGAPFTGFSKSGGLTLDSDQLGNTTLRQKGTFPVGTKENPVWYTVSITKNVTFTLGDGSSHTVPVTFSITGNFWSDFNYCPATYGRNNQRQSWWLNGKIQGDNAGMDFPISGEAAGTAITSGKLAIEKTVIGTTETETFQFTIKNANGEYLTFNGTACTGTSAELTDACKVSVTAGQRVFLTDVPVGVYTVTELQKDRYIVTDADGNSTGNYTVDYTVENKEEDSIPVASFTNKKLTDEAGVSIQKTAAGLPATITYPNPVVTIYSYTDGVKGDAVWSNALTANGDRLYLSKTLLPGTYLIEEAEVDVDGYNCTATLSGVQVINGMTFTVAAGQRYDLTIHNQYEEKPSTTTITLEKNVTGNMGDWSKEFTFEVYVDGVSMGTYQLSHKSDPVTITDVPIDATVKIVESGNAGYVVSATVDGTDTTVTADGETDYITFEASNADGHAVVFTNDKEVTIDTGVTTDSIPYVLLLTMAVIGAGALLLNKRRAF